MNRKTDVHLDCKLVKKLCMGTCSRVIDTKKIYHLVLFFSSSEATVTGPLTFLCPKLCLARTEKGRVEVLL